MIYIKQKGCKCYKSLASNLSTWHCSGPAACSTRVSASWNIIVLYRNILNVEYNLCVSGERRAPSRWRCQDNWTLLWQRHRRMCHPVMSRTAEEWWDIDGYDFLVWRCCVPVTLLSPDHVLNRFAVHFSWGSIPRNDCSHGDPEDPEWHDVMVFCCGAGERADAD